MTTRWPVAVLAAVMLWPAMSHAGSPDGAWFEGLRQNQTGASCCNIADCKITHADWRGGEGGQWWAAVPGGDDLTSKMTPIPRDKELRNKQSPDGEAYVCSGYDRRIYCFIPPNLGF